MNWWENDLETVGRAIEVAVVPALITALTPVIEERIAQLEAELVAKITSLLGGKPA
jgi:hypothetical protein